MDGALNTAIADPADLEMLASVFGPDLHPPGPLGWDAVHEFEARHGIVLPEPYRSFVATVTAGGSQLGPPDYGLLALGELPDDWGTGRAQRVLAEPFPLTESWVWEGDEDDDGEPVEPPDAVFDHGSIVLGTDGCGMYWHLIVTGEHRGHVWTISDVGAQPFGARFGQTSGQPGFAGWVRHWHEGKDWFDLL